MRKFEDWLNSIPLAGMIGAAFFTGTIYGREFDISWETLAAGFLGLGGGFLAFLAATSEQRANRERNTFVLKSEALTPTKDVIRNIQFTENTAGYRFFGQLQTTLNSITELEKVLVRQGPLEKKATGIISDLGNQMNWLKSASRMARTTIEVNYGVGSATAFTETHEAFVRSSLRHLKKRLHTLEEFCDPAYFLT
ncbi:hypothetical protein [Thalassospira xiamenensis]|uniref:hypothetical protein n=1 Tax=Thalassospira xiamenensis TaxID=220697 RepID=UPI001E2EC956|nr:hypothetical protein [Thalassospira xiamenensis]MCD1593374.1 hypothetical protein [Thalassospira xiamenensis]